MKEEFADLPTLCELGELLAVAFRDAERAERSRPATLLERLRRRLVARSRGTLLLAGLALVGLAGGALAGTDIIHFGAPVEPGKVFSHPHRGAGAILPGSARLLGVRAADPADGLAWGMRIVSTTRGVGCIQIGRLLRGRLGVYGIADAFNNDGRFHELRPRGRAGPETCTLLDRDGRIFLAVHVDYMPASAAQSCIVRRFFHGAGAPPACRMRDERTLDYGLLGPQAKSVTYRARRGLRTVPTVGAEGAYLIVRRAAQQSRADGVAAGQLPVGGSMVAIEWRDGSVCHLPSQGRPYPAAACSPKGYIAPPPRIQPASGVRARVRARVIRTSHDGRHALIEVTFTARAAVSDARGSYQLTWSAEPSSGSWYELGTQSDIRAGATVRKHFVVRRPGVYRGTVQYSAAREPILRPGGWQGSDDGVVGRFRVVVR